MIIRNFNHSSSGSNHVKHGQQVSHHSLEYEVDHLFRKLTVSEIISLESSKRRELDLHNHSLRAAVGDKYLDLLTISERVQQLSASTNNIGEGLSELQRVLEKASRRSRNNKSNSLSRKDTVPPTSMKPSAPSSPIKEMAEKKRFISLACQAKILLESHESIWKALEKENFISSCRIYLLGQAIYNNFEKQPINGKSAMTVFPVVPKQWEAIRELSRDILTRLDESGQRMISVSQSEAMECILTLVLAKGHTLMDAIELFMEKRRLFLLGFYNNLSHSNPQEVAKCLQDTFDLLMSTLYSMCELLMGLEGADSSSSFLETVYNRLYQGVQINQFVEVPSPSSASKFTFVPLFGSKVNVDLVFPLLPGNVQFSRVPEASNVTLAKVLELCRKWYNSVRESLINQLLVISEGISSLEALCLIKNSFVSHVNESHPDRVEKYGTISELLLVGGKSNSSLDFYEEIFKGVFNDSIKYHIEKLLTDVFRTQCEAFEKNISIKKGSGINASSSLVRSASVNLSRSLTTLRSSLQGALVDFSKFLNVDLESSSGGSISTSADYKQWALSSYDRKSLIMLFEKCICDNCLVLHDRLWDIYQVNQFSSSKDSDGHILLLVKSFKYLMTQLATIEKSLLALKEEEEMIMASGDSLFEQCLSKIFSSYEQVAMVWLKRKVDSFFGCLKGLRKNHFNNLELLTYNWESFKVEESSGSTTESEIVLPTQPFGPFASCLYNFTECLIMSMDYTLEKVLVQETLLYILQVVFSEYVSILAKNEDEFEFKDKFSIQAFYDLVYLGKLLIEVDVDIERASCRYQELMSEIRSFIDPVDLSSVDTLTFSNVEKYNLRTFGIINSLLPNFKGLSDRRKISSSNLNISNSTTSSAFSKNWISKTGNSSNVRFVHLPTGHYPSLQKKKQTSKSRSVSPEKKKKAPVRSAAASSSAPINGANSSKETGKSSGGSTLGGAIGGMAYANLATSLLLGAAKGTSVSSSTTINASNGNSNNSANSSGSNLGKKSSKNNNGGGPDNANSSQDYYQSASSFMKDTSNFFSNMF